MPKRRRDVTIGRFWYIFLVVVIITLAALVIFFSVRAYDQYFVFRSHVDYFRSGNPQIQSWMNIHTIERRFNITQDVLASELNVSASKISQKSTLNSICNQYRLNCTQIVDKLNNLIT